ncbi:MAG: L-rhamnose mutarotase [Planctomycetota bacterium]
MNRLVKFVLVGSIVLSAMNFGCAGSNPRVQRFGNVIGIKKENIAEYNRLHTDTWPGVLKMIADCNIQNYSIYLAEVEPDKFYLFSYFEYTGDDLAQDKKKMEADPVTQKWWKVTDPLQVPVPTRREGEWWHVLQEVFHTD